MRIGFDGKRAVQNFTGLGNYSRYIVDILCQFYPENEYVLYAQYGIKASCSQCATSENERLFLIVAFFRNADHRNCICGWLGKSFLKNIVSAL